MSTDLEKLVVQLEANMRNFERGMERAQAKANGSARRIERRFDRTNQTLARGFQNMSRVATGALGAIGVAVGAAQLRQLIGDSLEAAEAINDMSRRAGVSAEFLQEMRFAADQNGASVRDFDDAISRLNRRLGLFLTDGGGPAAAAFRALGLETRITSGELTDAESVFNAAVRALEGVESAAQRSAIASQLFGEDSGPRLAQMIGLGVEGLEQFAQAARDSGRVLSDELVAKGAQANAVIRAMRGELATAAQAEVLEYTDELVALSEALAEIARWGIQAAAALGSVLQLGGFVSDRLRPAATPEAAREQAEQARMLAERVGLIPAAARGQEVQDFLGREFTQEALRRGMREAADEGLAFRARNERAIEIQRELIAAELNRLAQTLSERADRLALDPPGGGGGAGNGGGSAGEASQGFSGEIRVPAGRTLRDPIENPEADKAKELSEEQAAQIEALALQFRDKLEWGLEGALRAASEGRAVDFFAQNLQSAVFESVAQGLANAFAEHFTQSAFGSFFSGLFTGSFNPTFGGGKAAGGPVRAGYAYRVGERGPETIIPAQNGMVIPAQAPLRPHPTAPVNVNNFHLHAEGAVMTDELLREMDAKAARAGAMSLSQSRQDLVNLQKRQSRALRR